MRAFQTAAVAALEALMPASRVHRPNEVPDSPTTGYAVVSVSTGRPTNDRGGAMSASRGHRVTVQAVGRDVDEVGWVVEKAEAAFLGKRLTVPGYACTPCRSEVSSQVFRDPDGGAYLLCTVTYTFASTPA